jgi:anti-sigma regulatory factor (Ser/Thr protein kinase)
MDVAALPQMRDRVRAYLRDEGLDDDLVEDVVLCLQEACKNAIRFSGSHDAITLRLAPSPGALRIVVRDHGIGMQPSVMAISPPPLADHGRGLQIIRRLMDQVEVRVDRGTDLRMVKYVQRAPQAEQMALSA